MILNFIAKKLGNYDSYIKYTTMKNTENNMNDIVNIKPIDQTFFFKTDDIPRSFASFEHLVIKLIELLSGKKYIIIKQGIISKNNKHYDVLIVQEKSKSDDKPKMKLVFDISETWNEVYKIK